MPSDLIEGTFVNVKDDGFVDFLIKTGCPKSEAEQMKGTHWKSRVEKVGEGTYVGCITCEECSAMNSVETFKEGTPKEIDHPLWGGKATITFSRTGDNSFKCCAKTEKFGSTEWTEKYTEDGLEMCFTHKESGASYKEFWCRKVKMLGWFELDRMEGAEEFMKAAKTPNFVDMTATMRTGFFMDGDTVIIREQFGKMEIVSRFKVDEEFTYAPGTPLEGKLLCTKTGKRSWKFIYVTKRGEEHWDLEFCSKGLKYEALHKQSGARCTLYFNPCVNMFGTWKPVSVDNMITFGQAIGMPVELCQAIQNDRDARVNWVDAGNGFVHMKYTSKYMPMDLAFKWGEEFEHSMPVPGGAPMKFKVTIAKQGDTITDIWKNDKSTTITTIKFTGDWAIICNKILGTDIMCKEVYQRV